MVKRRRWFELFSEGALFVEPIRFNEDLNEQPQWPYIDIGLAPCGVVNVIIFNMDIIMTP